MFIRTLFGRRIALSPDEPGGGGGNPGGGDPAGGGTKTFTQAELDAIVRDRLQRERGKYADYDQLKAAADELHTLKTASQSDIERITGERDTLKGQNGSLSAENLRLKVALKKGLTGDKAVLADRLSGSTETEMEADADELLKLFGAGNGGAPPFDAGPRGGGGPQQGMDALIRRAAGRT